MIVCVISAAVPETDIVNERQSSTMVNDRNAAACTAICAQTYFLTNPMNLTAHKNLQTPVSCVPRTLGHALLWVETDFNHTLRFTTSSGSSLRHRRICYRILLL